MWMVFLCLVVMVVLVDFLILVVVFWVAVIGGGIAGIFAAWNLAQQGLKVALIEKNHMVTGDSSATTGFLTRVPDTSVADFLAKHGQEMTEKLFAANRSAQKLLFDLMKEQNIDCDFRSCLSLYGSYSPSDSVLEKSWDLYRQFDHQASFVQRVGPFLKAVRFDGEGQFHVRKFLFALLDRKPENLSVYEETEVTDVVLGQKVLLRTKQGTVTCGKVVVAIGDPSSLFPELSAFVKPKLSYVLAAEYDHLALSDDLFWDTFDPYFYFRKVDANTLIAGGCDVGLDHIAEQKPFEKLEGFLKKRLPGTFRVTHQWSGSLFCTDDGVPYVFEHPLSAGKVYVATGFGGNGLVMGSFAGHVASEMALGHVCDTTQLFDYKRNGLTVLVPAKNSSADGTIQSVRTGFVFAATVDEFEKKNMLCRVIQGEKIIIFKSEDRFFALHNRCSHAGGSLSQGVLDGKTIECPLHAAKFHIETGDVLSPPATRPQKKYNVRVRGNKIEVEFTDHTSSLRTPFFSSSDPTISDDPHRGFWSLLRFSLGAFLFAALEFAIQYFWLTKGDIGSSLVRSLAFSGATLFGFALFLSAIFKWFPQTAASWRIRRRAGVAGFIFTLFHVLAVTKFFFDFDLTGMYFSWNPLVNPIIYGSIAFPLFFIMAATSTDWMVEKLTPRVWKWIHRFVYFAYVSSIFHFVSMNPVALNTLPGYLLLATTLAALVGQLYWFISTSMKRRFQNAGFYVGLTLIFSVAIFLFYVVGFFDKP
jgi:glycine/D-amino acid oxidase-like deaminating enzyme/nitrite reductase/ring-hydroxylating ferredoxin subunit/DMSO/TMAO reductase YedYZ heme-binding membrane subunit